VNVDVQLCGYVSHKSFLVYPVLARPAPHLFLRGSVPLFSLLDWIAVLDMHVHMYYQHYDGRRSTESCIIIILTVAC
jgi:hypothetical protein